MAESDGRAPRQEKGTGARGANLRRIPQNDTKGRREILLFDPCGIVLRPSRSEKKGKACSIIQGLHFKKRKPTFVPILRLDLTSKKREKETAANPREEKSY